MARKVDKETILGFAEEVKSYLPKILDCIDDYKRDQNDLGPVEEAHRFFHSIKGAASMLGFSGLSHIAYYAEEAMEEIAAGQLQFNREATALLALTVSQIEVYVDCAALDKFDEKAILSDVAKGFRRLKGLPESEDEEVIAKLLAPALQQTVAKEQTPSAALSDRFEEASSDIIEAFLQEAEEHFRNISGLLSGLESDPQNRELQQQIRRSVHTLKGSAGMVGFRNTGQLAHRMEDLLEGLFEGSIPSTPEAIGLIFTTFYALEDMVGSGRDEAGDGIEKLYAEYSDLLGEPARQDAPVQFAGGWTALEEEGLVDLSQFAASAKRTDDSSPDEAGTALQRSHSQAVRVPIERLDELVRLVSELMVNRSTFEQYFGGLVREISELKLSVGRLQRIAGRLETEYEASALGKGISAAVGATSAGGFAFKQGNGGSYGFDELEFDRYTEFHLLTRELAETAGDLNSVGNELSSTIGDFNGYLGETRWLTTDVQDKLMRLRMVPLASLASRLHRTVRVTAGQQGKAVRLVIEGENVELDKTVLEEIADPLLHILRNAVDHGIEPPALRQAIGKSGAGQIKLRAFYESTQVVVEVSDDGAGIESEAVRAAAVRAGIVTEADAEKLTEEELYSLLFMPGFSTTTEVSEISGRGVGLDIVKAAAQKLKGTVKIDSTPGRGTSFVIRLPMTLAIARVIMVKANNETFAIPLAAVTGILRIDRNEIEHLGQKAVLRIDGKVYPVVRIGEVLELKQPPDDSVQKPPALILNIGGKQIALVADHILEGREAVVKPLGNLLKRVHGVTGATIMGDGAVVLILNPNELFEESAQKEIHSRSHIKTTGAAPRKALNIMVVDDSVSVRRVLTNLIKGVGWNPIAAKDGLEALEIIQSSAVNPDILLLDIEMPRMDGYELTATLRASSSYKDIPIVMLTSRAGEKHRAKAMDIGASEYLIKPYRDEVLINVIRRLAQSARVN